MKNTIVFILFSILLLPSCGLDFDFEEEITFRNFTVSMDENPEAGGLIGILEASSSYGKLTFETLPQTPAGAISFNYSNCEIRVDNAELFDFETNPIIKGRIAMSNKDNVDTAFITLNLRDLEE